MPLSYWWSVGSRYWDRVLSILSTFLQHEWTVYQMVSETINVDHLGEGGGGWETLTYRETRAPRLCMVYSYSIGMSDIKPWKLSVHGL